MDITLQASRESRIAIITNDNISPLIIKEIVQDTDSFNIYTVQFGDIEKIKQTFDCIYNLYSKIFIIVYDTIGIIDKRIQMSFFPLDYVGGDLRYDNNTIEDILHNTINDNQCVAFNTKGYLKREINYEKLSPNLFLGLNGGIFVYTDKIKSRVEEKANNSLASAELSDNLPEGALRVGSAKLSDNSSAPQVYIQQSLLGIIPKLRRELSFSPIYTKRKKIKIALCLSGQPRFYNSSSFESLYHFIINEYDTDVFIHSWISKQPEYKYECAPWSNIKSIHIPSTAEIELNFLYNPKGIKVEEPRIFPEYFKEGNYSANNIPSMFYSVQQADILRREYEKANNIKYDYVIRARTDTLLKTFIDLATLDKNYIHIPDNCPNTICYNDNFSIAGRNIADKCYNVFDILPEYFREGSYYAEGMWLKNIEINNLPVNLINIQQTFVRK